MSKSVFLVFIAAVLVEVAYTQTISAGGCPDVTVQNNFEPGLYFGKWYEYARSFAAFELGGTCVTAEYSGRKDNTVRVYNNMFNIYSGSPQSIKGTAKLASNNGEAKLQVEFPSAPFPAPYWVLSTDYETYSVVWGCLDLGIISARNAWILTRERHPSPEVIKTAYRVLDANRIQRDFLTVTEQNNCKN